MELGERLRLHIRPSGGDGPKILQCGTQRCAPSHSYGPAVRDYYLLHYVVSGKGFFQSGKSRFELRAGHCFLIRPGQLTVYSADRSEPWEYIWVGFTGERAAPLLRDAGFTEDSPVIDDSGCRVFFHGMIGDPDGDGSDAGVRADGLCNALRVSGELLRFFSRRIRRCQEHTASGQLAARAMDFIKNNLENDLSVARLASDFGYSRSHFSTLFKREAGRSPRQYLLETRMKRAALLLETTALNVSHIARSVGYEDALLFSRLFRKHMGKSPRDWRKV